MEAHETEESQLVVVRVGGIPFCLDGTTIDRMDSKLLSNVVNRERGVTERPRNEVYEVRGRDAECFSAFVHMARFGSIPMNLISIEAKKKCLMREANSWGVRSLVDNVASKDRELFRESYSSKLEGLRRGRPPKEDKLETASRAYRDMDEGSI